jgi:hypothetical protein
MHQSHDVALQRAADAGARNRRMGRPTPPVTELTKGYLWCCL